MKKLCIKIGPWRSTDGGEIADGPKFGDEVTVHQHPVWSNSYMVEGWENVGEFGIPDGYNKMHFTDPEEDVVVEELELMEA